MRALVSHVLWPLLHTDTELLTADGSPCAYCRGTEYLQAYQDLPKAVERADFFRYLVVLRYGGLYADTDVECVSSIDNAWHGVPADTTMAVGIERTFSSLEAATKRTYVRQRQVRQRASPYFHPRMALFTATLPHGDAALTWKLRLSRCARRAVRAAAAMGVHGGAKSPGNGTAV